MRDHRETVRRVLEGMPPVHAERVARIRARPTRGQAARLFPSAGLGVLTVAMVIAAVLMAGWPVGKPGDRTASVGHAPTERPTGAAPSARRSEVADAAGPTEKPAGARTVERDTGAAPACAAGEEGTEPYERTDLWGHSDTRNLTLEELSLYTPRVVVATVEDVLPARWSTPDACEPADARGGSRNEPGYSTKGFHLSEPYPYRPVELRVERTVTDAAGAALPYGLYGGKVGSYTLAVAGGSAPARTLTPGRRYLIFARPAIPDKDTGEMGDQADAATLVVAEAWDVDEQDRVSRPGSATEPLSRVVSSIQQTRARDADLPLDVGLNLVRVGGVTYGGDYWLHDSGLTDEHLGAEIARVRKTERLEWEVDADGEASGLKPGTQLYSVKGYSPRFRLAARAYGRVYSYLAGTNPGARAGADLLDIRGKVGSIEVLRNGRSAEQPSVVARGKVEDAARVSELVDLVLDAPVVKGRINNHDPEQPIPQVSYAVWFVLRDGTRTVVELTYWPEWGELATSGTLSPTTLKTPKEFGAAIEEAVGR